MKKALAFVGAAALVLSVAACRSNRSRYTYAPSTAAPSSSPSPMPPPASTPPASQPSGGGCGSNGACQ